MKVAVLGDGITAKSVRSKIKELHIPETDIESADFIICSPGIPPAKFPKTNKPIISEIEFAYRLLKLADTPPKIIAVTGTNGKTTVTALIAHILQIPYAGNIGVPLMEFVGQEKKLAAIVVELSSYQLETCADFKPDIAIMLNITPDHLERHKTMQNYVAAKAKIFAKQTDTDSLIYWQADEFLTNLSCQAKSKKYPYSLKSKERDIIKEINLIGDHNILNATAAIICARLCGLSDSLISKRLATFQTVEHRIELVLNERKRVFYNDSKSTNPDSTIVAINACSKPINLIIGGKDKGLDLEEFIKFVFSKAKTCTVFGEIADRFVKEAHEINSNKKVFQAKTIEQAIDCSYKLSKENEIILFSPACSSFDQFQNYEHRGKKFKELIKRKYSHEKQK
jgi:UDP-N-acetylmuramoylalanine--D-glutamate ligase